MTSRIIVLDLGPRQSDGFFSFCVWSQLVLALCVCALFSKTALAASGTRVTLPSGKPKSGLQLTLDTAWVEGTGYRPLQIEAWVFPAGPASADRNFRIELQIEDWVSSSPHSTAAFLDIPEGQSSAAVSIPVLQRAPWQMLRITTYEDGRKIEELSKTIDVSNPGNNFWNANRPVILVVDPHAPDRETRGKLLNDYRRAALQGKPLSATHELFDIRGIASVSQPETINITDVPTVDDSILLQLLEDELPGLAVLPPGELPRQWIEYSSLDIVFIRLAELAKLQKNDPSRFAALTQWAATGGTLCVFGAGAENKPFSRLPELEELLGMAALPVEAGSDQLHGWTQPRREEYGRSPEYWSQEPRYETDQFGNWVEMAPEPGPPVVPLRPGAIPPFVLRDFKLGKLIALSEQNPFPGSVTNWNWLFRSLDAENRSTWVGRHGISLYSSNSGYWLWLIPGVGLPPVNAFRLLITLFVIVIGPVNYFLLRRKNRLYLLLITVPAGAAVVTFGLLGYAMLADGLGVRARVRSFTLLDQKSGQAESWSWQTYYAGLAPSEGMNFPSDTAVYPILSSEEEQAQQSMQVEWNEGLHIVRGGLRSRVTSQFQVIHSGKTDQKLVLQPEKSSALIAGKNELGTRIVSLYLADEDGAYFSAENIGAGETFKAEPDSGQAAIALRSLFYENQPENPGGFDPFSYGRYGRWSRGPYRMQYDVGEGSVMNSRMEHHIAASTATADDIPPLTYVAVVESSPFVPLGTTCREEASFHVIRGTWQP